MSDRASSLSGGLCGQSELYDDSCETPDLTREFVHDSLILFRAQGTYGLSLGHHTLPRGFRSRPASASLLFLSETSSS